jgi:ketosteroid isomerase-like protein
MAFHHAAILAHMPSRLVAALALVLASSFVPAHAQTTSEAEVQAALSSFIRAFDNLEWDAFRMAFDDNATVFYPRAFPERANGRAEFEQTFKKVYEQIRNGRTAPPYMDIQPRELKIQMFGDVAIATFHLDDRAGFVNRRTIVLHKTPAGWKIVHLHASEVSLTSQSPQAAH